MLALIAGRGGLPQEVAEAQSDAPLVCALAGFDPDTLAPDLRFRIEHLGSLLADLKARGVSEVCLCGAISRPAIDPSQIDAATMPLVPILQKAIMSGDDGALRGVIAVFEAQGFAVRAAHELAPDIVAPAGVLTQAQPDAQMEKDAARGLEVLRALAPLDVGQGCVVAGGQVLGIEAAGGTDHMLATLPQTGHTQRPLLIKIPKAGQDLRADMPTIGPDTIDALQRAQVGGLVIEAGAVIMLRKAQTIARANAAGVVIWSREAE